MTPFDPALMKRSAIALAALMLYGAGASYAVHRQAEAYRESLRPKTIVAETPKPQPPEIKAEPVIEPVTVLTSAEPEEAVPERPRPPVVVDKVKKSPLVVSPPKESASAGDSKVAAELADLDESAKKVWDTPAVKKVYDPERFSDEDERELGATLNDLIGKTARIADEGPEGLRLKKAGDPLRKKLTKKDVTYTILDTDEYNIFSHPGGYIYVTTGMLMRIGNDEDYVLKFAIAHELAHRELGHTLQCLKIKGLREAMKATDSGTAETIYQRILPIAYPDDMEFAADHWALQAMRELGHDEYESLRFLVKLDKLAEAKNFGQGHIAARPNMQRSLLDNHIRAHVAVSDRLAQARAFWSGKPIPAPR